MRDVRHILLLVFLILASSGSMAIHQDGVFHFDNEKEIKDSYIGNNIANNNHAHPWFLFQKIPLNSASSEQLCLIKGIGKKTARKIISYRNLHGPFVEWDELLPIDGIGKKTIVFLAESTCLEKNCD